MSILALAYREEFQSGLVFAVLLVGAFAVSPRFRRTVLAISATAAVSLFASRGPEGVIAIGSYLRESAKAHAVFVTGAVVAALLLILLTFGARLLRGQGGERRR
jgi:Na+/H+ antiporter NhaD/arsenite permease-like protein